MKRSCFVGMVGEHDPQSVSCCKLIDTFFSRVSYISQMPKEFGIIIAGQILFCIIFVCCLFPSFLFSFERKNGKCNAMFPNFDLLKFHNMHACNS